MLRTLPKETSMEKQRLLLNVGIYAIRQRDVGGLTGMIKRSAGSRQERGIRQLHREVFLDLSLVKKV